MVIGDEVPDFELPDQDGTPRRLSTLLAGGGPPGSWSGGAPANEGVAGGGVAAGGGPIVLFFYPAAMTSGCTKEACHFRDLAAAFRSAGVQRVGISRDDVSKQKQFSDRHSFDYPLLADVDGSVAELFGVRRGRIGERLGAPVKRWTFAIGTDRRVVAAIHSEVNMQTHADEALAALT